MKTGPKFKSLASAEAAFKKKLEEEPLAPRTRSFYSETAHACLMLMGRAGLHTLPHEISAEDLRELLDVFDREKLAVATRKGYLSALKKYLKLTCDTSPFSSLRYHLPKDVRPCVDWYTLEQARTLLQCDKTPLQSIVIHCELCLGMRRVEIIRLRPEDIHDPDAYVDVRGKSSKLRSIPYTKGTREILQMALARRDEQIRNAKPQQVPENLILWSKAGKLHAYSEEGYGLDKMVTEPLTEKLGFRVTNHKGRRTFGRTLYRAGVPVATIAKILGHDSTEVTLRYIGVDLDDMRSAMQTELYA